MLITSNRNLSERGTVFGGAVVATGGLLQKTTATLGAQAVAAAADGHDVAVVREPVAGGATEPANVSP